MSKARYAIASPPTPPINIAVHPSSSVMDLLKQASLTLRFVKFRRFLGSLFLSYQRDWIEREFKHSQNLKAVEETGNIQKAESTTRGGHFYFLDIELEICFLSADLVRIDWKPGIPPIPYGIVEKDWAEVEINFEQIGGDRTIISSNALKVIVSPNGSLEFQNAQGQTLRQELPPQRQVKLSQRVKSEGWVHQAKLQPEERIYGLGERAARLNLRTSPDAKEDPRQYQMWNYDAGGRYGPGTDPLYLCIPIYLGLHSGGSYLIFYENTYRATFSFKQLATADFEGGALRYYFTTGSPAQLLEHYTELTGRPALPPRWVFGYHQSRWGYETEQAVRDVVKGFQTHDLPLSAIHLDIDCKDRFRSFTIDPDRFPKLTEFNQELAAKGVRLIAIVNPGVKADRKNRLFQEGRAQEVFCTLPNGEPVLGAVWPGMCAFPDFTNPLARHWWSRQYEYLLDLGITGFWHDMNEPGVFTLWGDATLPLPTRHFMEGRGGDHLEAHNVYGLLQARAGYEALCEYQPERRPFIVSRAGWAGLARYAWTWTGDVETSWAALRQTVATVLGMSLSGIPYTGPDIGGFKGNPSSELYLRWFQMACFLPFCRTHSANNVKPRTPWTYGAPTVSIVRQFLRLRYRLIPYFYTLAWEASQTGHPPIRPLFWFDSDDRRLWDVEDAFFVGDALLVCPIVEQGARKRQAILPKGSWYNFWDDTLIEGATEINLAAPLQEIPLLVKAGSILPMEMDDKLILHLYFPTQEMSQGCLYSDAGDGYGEWRLDRFRLLQDEQGLELIWQQQGAYEFPYKEIELYLHGMELKQACLDDIELTCLGEESSSTPTNRLVVKQPFDRVRFQKNFQSNRNQKLRRLHDEQ
ncbi:glycoside hydrolase family 31 protein [Microcoleus sp. herbarium7]|uniref:glycoside hydrolase family 31 protein n=1 Tax=Microcoleus sp. herbarium7 TaxID=3055435 RepID=UPI002FD3794F